MKKAVLRGPRQFDIVNAEVPLPQPDDLLVKVHYCGICGSDLHAFEEKNQFVKYPYVPGHEFVGEVIEIGIEVTRFETGQLVTVDPVYPAEHVCIAAAVITTCGEIALVATELLPITPWSRKTRLL